MKPPKTLLTVLFACVCIHVSYAQDTVVNYLNDDFKPVEPEKGSVIALAVKRDSLWEAVYYKISSKAKLLNCYFKDDDFSILHGLYEGFYDDGKTMSSKGWYQNGRKAGVWRSWFNNGNMRDSAIFRNGELILLYAFSHGDYGRRIGIIKNVVDDHVLMYHYYPTGQLREESEHKGKTDWSKYYYESGETSEYIKKEDGKVVSQVCYSRSGEKIKCPDKSSQEAIVKAFRRARAESRTEPEFPGGEGNLQLYINNNFKVPSDFNTAVKVDYTARVSFKLTAKGRVFDVRIIQSSHADLDRPLLELFQNMPMWEMRGFKGKEYGPITMPINFNIGR